MKRLAIMGAGGHAKVVADIAMACGWSEILFFEDSSSSYPGFNEMISQKERFQGFFIAIGNNEARRKFLLKIQELKLPTPNLIHPSAVLSPKIKLGQGIAIMPLVAVNTGTVIEDGCILNTRCSVDHDCYIGSFVHLSPGTSLAGGVSVDELSWIGIGSCVIDKIKISSSVQVAAGAAVTQDLLESGLYMGVPAKRMSKNDYNFFSCMATFFRRGRRDRS